MADTTVTTSDNGPYWVSGSFVVCDADGNEFPVQGRRICVVAGSRRKNRSATGLTTWLDFPTPAGHKS